MARGLENDGTLKVGLMYIDVQPQNSAVFNNWLTQNRPSVKVKTTQMREDKTEFVKFQVINPGVPWASVFRDVKLMGYPTMSPGMDTKTTVQERGDTPPEPSLLDKALGNDEDDEGSGDILTTKGKIILVVVAVVGGAAFVAKKIYLDPWLKLKKAL